MGLPIDSAVFKEPPPPSIWPYREAPSLRQTQISEYGVGVPARQEVEFKDGQRIWLRRVSRNDVPCLFLRDLGEPAEGARIDLRDFIADVEAELPQTSTRDVAGYVAISLRLQFPTRAQFLEAVSAKGRPA